MHCTRNADNHSQFHLHIRYGHLRQKFLQSDIPV